MQLRELYRHRQIWLGIAVLGILAFHLELDIQNILFAKVKSLGYAGVDIFLFASGLGNYFSYEKTACSMPEFMKRRIVKLAPTYLVFMILWLPYMIAVHQMSLPVVLSNFFAIQGFTGVGQEFNWYITAILVLYILTPLFYNLVKNAGTTKTFVTIILSIVICSFGFWKAENTIIIATRFPIYLIGMYFAKNEEENISKKAKMLLAIGVISGFILLEIFINKFNPYLWSYGLYWYPFILITPGFCIMISYLFKELGHLTIIKILKSILSKIGEYSFEVYLLHIWFLDIYREIILPHGILKQNNLSQIILIIAMIPIAVTLKYLAGVFREKYAGCNLGSKRSFL